jgi:glycolate oxidase iron-sulfur subunit
MSGLFAHTNQATTRVLTANGYRVTPSSGDGCCGALHAHAGDAAGARRLAQRNIAAFERTPDAFIAVNASGCGAMLKEYGALFAQDSHWQPRAEAVAARVKDISELLSAMGPRAGGQLPLRVAYDAPCHLMHAQRVVAPPLAVLDAVPGLSRVPLAGHDMCCGSAGIYNLIEPAVSDAVLRPKIADIAQSGADMVATGNPGCIMQIGAGLLRTGSRMRVVHPVDILDASYASGVADESLAGVVR